MHCDRVALGHRRTGAGLHDLIRRRVSWECRHLLQSACSTKMGEKEKRAWRRGGASWTVACSVQWRRRRHPRCGCTDLVQRIHQFFLWESIMKGSPPPPGLSPMSALDAVLVRPADFRWQPGVTPMSDFMHLVYAEVSRPPLLPSLQACASALCISHTPFPDRLLCGHLWSAVVDGPCRTGRADLLPHAHIVNLSPERAASRSRSP